MTIATEDVFANPLTIEQNQRAAALTIASSVDFISTTDEALSLADYIVGCQCPEPGPLFGPFSTSLDFELTDFNADLFNLLTGTVAESVEVGQEFTTYDEVKALPVGTTLTDRQVGYIDGTWVVTEDGPVFNEGTPWQEDSREAFQTYAPFTVTSLPDAKDEDDEPEKPAPIFAVGDHVSISKFGGEQIGRAGRYMGQVTRVVEDYEHEDGGVRYYETTVRPGGVWENFLEWAHEYVVSDDIEGEVYVLDQQGFDALPDGTVVAEVVGNWLGYIDSARKVVGIRSLVLGGPGVKYDSLDAFTGEALRVVEIDNGGRAAA